MSSVKIETHVHNDLGYTMTSYWVVHRATSSSSADAFSGTSLPQGGDSPTFQVTLESSTTDLWTVMWIDPQNNLLGTPLNFAAEAFQNGGSIEIQLQSSGSKVEILQGGKTDGSAGVLTYGIAT